MKKFAFLFVIMLIVQGCPRYSYVSNQNSFVERVVREEQLPNGKVVMIGRKAPSEQNMCTLVNEVSENWEALSIKKNFTLKGFVGLDSGERALNEKAIDYVIQHPESNINYVSYTIPNEHNIGGFNAAFRAHAKTYYYSCQNPPSANLHPLWGGSN